MIRTRVFIVIFMFLCFCISIFCVAENRDDKCIATERVYEFYQLDSYPTLNGGNSLIDSILYSNLEYIDGESFVDGKVVISFIINEVGRVESIEVEKSLCRQCDINAIKALESLSNWRPGKKNGINVKSRMYIPIYFRIFK